MAIRLVSLGIALVLAVGGCAPSGSASPVPTPCGGSHTWPPNGYPAPPAGLTAERLSATAVRLANVTGTDWWYATTTWFDGDCTGWIATQPAATGTLRAQTSTDVTVRDPNAGLPYRIGVELWDHPCDEACTDDPTGFAWVPGTDAAETTSP